MSIQNDLLLRVARGEKTERTPVWVMRQAGRILPEYRATRQRAGSFIRLVTTPELACEVTLQPVDILGVDAAIIFSDILVIPEAMGLPYTMDEGRGPHFEKTIRTAQDIENLRKDEIEHHLSYVTEAIKLTKRALNNRVPLIGFAGAPWTLFCYMIEGKGSKEFSLARRMLFESPQLAHTLLGAITDATIVYLRAQINAGVDLVQIFDSWAGVLSRPLYQTFVIPYLKRICDNITKVPVTLFSKGAWFSISDLAVLNCATIGLDWQMDPAWARAEAGESKTLQGNLDPAVLYGSTGEIISKTKEMLSLFGPYRHIANLGHGVYPDIDPSKLKCFITTVQEFQHQPS